MNLNNDDIDKIAAILQPDEVFSRSHSNYRPETLCWVTNKDECPSLVLRPKTLLSLQKLVKSLYESTLDFGIRSAGVGSSSGKDLVLSMTAFNDFAFDSDEDTVIIGAGQTWGAVDNKMNVLAPGLAVVGARQPYVGVGGSILGGGLSWLSRKYGLMSDPANLLDARVVLYNGRALWASNKPDLLWALRGGGGNFGVVTDFKIKARSFTNKVFGGYVYFPQSALYSVSQAIAKSVNENGHPEVALQAFILNPGSPFFPVARGIGLFLYDGLGEKHARSAEGFEWLFTIEGATDMPKEQTLPELHRMTAATEQSMGKTRALMGGALVSKIDRDFLVRMSGWFDKVVSSDSALAKGSFAILEVLQECAMNSSGSPDATAWPHGYQQHVLQLGVGCLTSSSSSDEMSLGLLRKGYLEIAPSHNNGDFFPNLTEPFMDVSKIYKSNYAELRRLKVKYDPKGRLNKGICSSRGVNF